jgi:hypothetical protein
LRSKGATLSTSNLQQSACYNHLARMSTTRGLPPSMFRCWAGIATVRQGQLRVAYMSYETVGLESLTFAMAL